MWGSSGREGGGRDILNKTKNEVLKLGERHDQVTSGTLPRIKAKEKRPYHCKVKSRLVSRVAFLF